MTEVLTTLENSIMDVKKDCESKKRVSNTSLVLEHCMPGINYAHVNSSDILYVALESKMFMYTIRRLYCKVYSNETVKCKLIYCAYLIAALLGIAC